MQSNHIQLIKTIIIKEPLFQSQTCAHTVKTNREAASNIILHLILMTECFK